MPNDPLAGDPKGRAGKLVGILSGLGGARPFGRLKRGVSPLINSTTKVMMQHIDSYFVTCEEYQLFIQEMKTQGEYHQPAHWIDVRFFPSKTKEPITGVWFEDAQLFCKWLSQKKGIKYRLPTSTEFATISMESDSPFASWGQDGNLLWQSSETENMLRKEIAKISISQKPVTKLDILSTLDIAHAHTLQNILHHDNNGLIFKLSSVLVYFLDYDHIFRSGTVFKYEFQPFLKMVFDNLKKFLDIKHYLSIKHDHIIQEQPDTGYHYLEQEISKLFELVVSINFKDLLPVIRTIIAISSFLESRKTWGVLSDKLISKSLAETWIELRREYRRFALHLFEYAHFGSQIGHTKQREKLEETPIDLAEIKQVTCELYWFHRIMQLREVGKVPPWEGICLITN